MNTLEIARVAHEVNRAFCTATGDTSQLTWDEAPAWQKDSAIAGVAAHVERPRTPEESHALWLEHKTADGWVYGPVKDAAKKQHPCMVAYEELPREQRIKDYLFAAVVDSLK